MTPKVEEKIGACIRCGGTIVGDGYSTVRHCEFADQEDYLDKEPDVPTVLCRLIEEDAESRYREALKAIYNCVGVDHKTAPRSSCPRHR